VKIDAIDMPWAGLIETAGNSRFFGVFRAIGDEKPDRRPPNLDWRELAPEIAAQSLCVAQGLSESQILGAGCGWARWAVKDLSTYNSMVFRAAAAWHEA
jgi:hypothetical protein